ncbi:MAG: NAD(P)-dependent oxidoreductase [Bradyrhizobium sp.]|nr:NAD(P)-dependent oxidoreductase [Bradyrhizobium sp.]
MNSDLQMTPPPGTRVVVVGGCGGIGSVLVQACVALGHRVATLDLPRSIAVNSPPHGVFTISMDATRAEDVTSALADADRLLGGIDVLVNLVGFANRKAGIEELSDDEWDNTIRGNLDSFSTVCRRAIPILRRSDAAAIVNIASGVGVRPLAGGSPYSVAKAGVIALTKAIALECAPRIRANSVAPGVVQTAFLMGGTHNASAGAQKPDLEAYKKTVPMQRFAEPIDIVGPILFLASPAAGFINGQTLHVNGGGLMP